MLKPIVKQPGVTEGERYLAKLANSTFIGMWSYPSVYRDEGFSKNGIGQETADLLVVFKNTVIIFSEKDISFNSDIDIKVAWARWCRKSVYESIAQLRGSESFIRRFPNRLFLDRKCTERFPLEIPFEDLQIHLIAVTRNSGSPCKQYFDNLKTGSSQSLVFRQNLSKEDVLENPFFITDFEAKKSFVHVLDEYTLDLLMEELDTVTDFIHYLREKENSIREGGLFLIPGEEEFLAYYLNDRASDGYGRYVREHSRLPGQVEALHEGQWKKFTKSLDYALHKSLKTDGKFWLALLTRFSDCVLDANVGEGFDVPFLTHERTLRCLASENRLSRALLSKTMLGKYNSVPSNVRSARLMESTCSPSRLYIFVFFPQTAGMIDYEEYRKERLACMSCYAHVAKYKHEQFSEIIVLGVDSKGSLKASETVVAFDTSMALTPEQKVDAQHVMTTMEILTKTHQQRPAPLAMQNDKGGQPGRNTPCTCGSGIKAKRCCFR
ncbi:SEC-C domain-containing protein [Oxalobacteraceae bacterium]|nr:SEC-C domain-containing protein [Oxalobacteraceae bacterium]